MRPTRRTSDGVRGLAWVLRGTVDSGLNLRTASRLARVAECPMPTQLVPTASFIDGTGAFGRDSDRIMLGLLAHVLEQPQLKLGD